MTFEEEVARAERSRAQTLQRMVTLCDACLAAIGAPDIVTGAAPEEDSDLVFGSVHDGILRDHIADLVMTLGQLGDALMEIDLRAEVADDFHKKKK